MLRLQCIYATPECALSGKWMQMVCMPGDIYSARHLHMTVLDMKTGGGFNLFLKLDFIFSVNAYSCVASGSVR